MSDAFAHLSPEDRRRAEELAETFRASGAEAAEEWALSEVQEDIPQLARYLFLRSVWRSAAQWKEPPEDWFAPRGEDSDAGDAAAEDDPDVPTLVAPPADADGDGGDDDPPFHAAHQAVQRILAAGVDPRDLREVARAVFLHTAFDVVHTVDEGHDPDAPEGTPGWLLTEVGGDLVLTGRLVVALHEDLLTTDPDA